jgi:hypothetical protein
MSSITASGAASGGVMEATGDKAWWSGPFMKGLLVVQIVVGFEFFWSVLTKLVRGGFVSGLGADLADRVKAAPGWYASFAHDVVIPHATTFAYLIIAGEIFIGVVLIAAAVVWLARWRGMSHGARMTLVALAGLAALGALFMNLNFHIANGATNPWQIGESAFDEAVDINMLLTLIDATIVVVMASVLVSLRRSRAQG